MFHDCARSFRCRHRLDLVLLCLWKTGHSDIGVREATRLFSVRSGFVVRERTAPELSDASAIRPGTIVVLESKLEAVLSGVGRTAGESDEISSWKCLLVGCEMRKGTAPLQPGHFAWR